MSMCDWDGHNGVIWTTMEDEEVFENFFFLSLVGKNFCCWSKKMTHILRILERTICRCKRFL